MLWLESMYNDVYCIESKLINYKDVVVYYHTDVQSHETLYLTSSSMSARHDPVPPPLSDSEFEEILQRNKTVSSSAISRAVQDASAGENFKINMHTLKSASMG